MFEDALTVDELRNLVNKISRRRQTVSNEEKFSDEDLNNYSRFLTKLKSRYSELDTEVKTTYRISNKVLEYMEHKIIVDYLMEGKQKELEEEAPELADKAKEIFGNEFYYGLPTTKEKLLLEPKWLLRLKEKKNEVERKLNNHLESVHLENEYN